MWGILDKHRMMSGFWKSPVNPYDPQGGHSGTTSMPLPIDDDYPNPGQGSLLKSVLVWSAAALGVIALLAAVLILPGLIF